MKIVERRYIDCTEFEFIAGMTVECDNDSMFTFNIGNLKDRIYQDDLPFFHQNDVDQFIK